MRELSSGVGNLCRRGSRVLQKLPFLGAKLLLQAQCVFLQVGLGHFRGYPGGGGLARRSQAHASSVALPRILTSALVHLHSPPAGCPDSALEPGLPSEPWMWLSAGVPCLSSPCRSPGLRPGQGHTHPADALLNWPLPDLCPAPALPRQTSLEPPSSRRIVMPHAPLHLCTEPLKP